jgi:hypothetical protein
MNKWRLAAVLLVVALFIAYAVVVVAPQVILAQVCDREADRKVLDAQSDFFCPAGNQVAYNAWSECGLKKECIDSKNGLSNGSKFSAQGGQMRSKALYSQGKEADGWTGYDDGGKPLPQGGGYRHPPQAP